MVSKGKPSPKSSVKPLSDAQVQRLATHHVMVDSTRPFPTGPRTPDEREINEQDPKATRRLLNACCKVLRASCKVHSWGLEQVPEEDVFITACTHVTLFDVFVPMSGLFNLGRRPRYMAKAEMGKWPIIGKWFQLVGMQPVKRRSGQARAIEETSIEILTSGRPLTIWPEGTLTRDPKKWPMSMKNGVGYIALEASRRLGRQIPLYCAVVWGAASINHWFPWPRKNVVMGYDKPLDYSDLLADMDQWGDEPPAAYADELARRIRVRMKNVESEIRGIPAPEGYFDYRTMSYKPEPAPFVVTPQTPQVEHDLIDPYAPTRADAAADTTDGTGDAAKATDAHASTNE